MTGTLYGIGVGPGDPELITLKAARLIAACPIVAYPAPVGGTSFARQIADNHISSSAEEIVIPVPMQPDPAPAQAAYDHAAPVIAGHLEAGRDVAVLCEGDPFFYGSFIYLHDRLAADFPCEVVPGVSSLMACSAAMNTPLARRNDILTVLPATLDEPELTQRLQNGGAAAIIKLGRHLPKVRRILDQLGLTERAGYIERASLDEGTALPLAEAPATAPYFSMILVQAQ